MAVNACYHCNLFLAGQKVAGHFDGGGTRFYVPRIGGASGDLNPVTIIPPVPGMGVYFHGRLLHEGII
jgi:hypothetical protein